MKRVFALAHIQIQQTAHNAWGVVVMANYKILERLTNHFYLVSLDGDFGGCDDIVGTGVVTISEYQLTDEQLDSIDYDPQCIFDHILEVEPIRTTKITN